MAYGFYCLGISATDAKKLDEAIVRDNDGRNFVPFIYIYALAVREQFQTQKIGTLLLMHALDRCARFVLDVGAYGVALHAVNERVTKLYERYGFRQMNDLKRPFMILPAQSLVDLFGNNMAAR